MADQLAKLGSEHPFIGLEPAYCISMGVAKKVVRDWTIRDNRKHWDSLSGLTGKGTHTGLLCQENKGAVKFEQRPAMLGGRTTHMTVPSKRTHFHTAPGVKGA
jgi:hypothetical protein